MVGKSNQTLNNVRWLLFSWLFTPCRYLYYRPLSRLHLSQAYEQLNYIVCQHFVKRASGRKTKTLSAHSNTVKDNGGIFFTSVVCAWCLIKFLIGDIGKSSFGKTVDFLLGLAVRRNFTAHYSLKVLCHEMNNLLQGLLW